jgi:predicted AlkP superfamily pyrophosphatase or phosphodiesterase
MPLARQVILFVIDGLRPDALQQAPTPYIDHLVTQGSYTWQAQSVTPSISLPCHTSLFFAVPPSRHAVLSNVWTRSQPPIPSLIEVVHQANLGTASFYTWEELRDLASPGTLDFAYYHRLGDPGGDQDLEIGEMATAYIAKYKPAFAFVYLGATDEVGHRHGWMSEPYLRAVSKADHAIGLVLEGLDASSPLAGTVCLVLADHGGHEFDHNAGLAEDVTIPWVISGPGIRRGYQITRHVGIIDTAPTVAHLLGLPAPAGWSGQIVKEVLASS